MNERKAVAPEIQAILEEIAEDPRSRLLKVPKLYVPAPYTPPVRDREACLTRAEKELVKVHRYEVANLLYQEAYRAVHERDEADGKFLKYLRLDEVAKAPDPVEWEANTRHRLGATLPVVRKEPGYRLLEECVHCVPGARPSPIKLASASLRLVPSAATRICLALALNQAKKTGAAIGALVETLDGRPSELLTSLAWQNIGFIEGDRGHPQKEGEAMRTAALTLERRGDPAMAWLACALQAGNQKEVVRAGRQVGESVPVGHPSIQSFLRRSIDLRRRKGGSVDNVMRRTFQSVSPQLPEQAWQIGNVLSK